jgi:DhnA family fructose-bisphosphate aldolase class Ia
MRKRRLFNRGENVVIVAVDHGEFDGPIPGMIVLPKVVNSISPKVDGVLVSPGMLRQCSHVFDYKGAPLAVVRLNWSTVYCYQWGYTEASTVQAISAREAISLGADVALISLTLQTGSEERDARNVEVFCKLVNEAHKVGLPVVGEFFPTRADELSDEEMFAQVKASVRILAELGADMIKTFHTVRFNEVVEGCPIPIFGLGAAKLPTQLDALKLAAKEISDGARGVVFGRNAIQVSNPTAFQEALCEVVKRGESPDATAARFGLVD